MTKWRSLDYQDEATRRQLREVCPADTHGTGFDVEVALELIKNHPYYRTLVFAGQQEIADIFDVE